MLNPRTHSKEHADSYYAATRAYAIEYPELEGQHDTDICVIGGGFSGVNTALELAERGFKITLIEAYRIGWGASGRNGGQLIRGIGHGLEQFRNQIGDEGINNIHQMGFEAVEIVKERVKKYDIQCDLKMGYCDLANKPRHMREFEEELEWLDKMGYPYESRLLQKDEMQQVVGSDFYIGGLTDMGSGHVHPLNLVTGEAAAAANLGVTIFEQSPVTDIEYAHERNSDQHKISTKKGYVTANQLVICGNAYVAGLDKELEGTVLPAGSYVIATEPLSEEIANKVLPQDMAVCDQRVDLDYYRLSADRRLLFGGLCTYSGRDPKSIIDALRPNMDRVFPYLKDVKIDFQWGGMIGIGANRFPQVGRLHPSVYYAQAYSGHGVNATHMAAKIIAEAINDETNRINDYDKIKHMRFPGGRHFRSPMLAVGMLYHRFKDLF
ncbi:FAD-binding oxidoreductase [Bermanella marisrubri]|uniref:Oxidoreductase, putative n=1 Tax=Bermanella marisrubri TaxID=207949 RepID=Q1N5T9_9GAMM|nr:FAD-binding oxidoreductase [Bermanella marisrubri]EAT13853.1 oxidoreductase, putative [Oceanobacter sp. RED65] [Bermanella marisrubri]QIZ84614.1 FAD-binding oxidoreductase [Bermanella marisrubri]